MDAVTRARPFDLEEASEPTRDDAERAVRTLIRWIGDDPGREGLVETPARVLRAYEEWFAGYREDAGEHLARTFEEAGGYDEPVILRGIAFRSCCEHHMAPITGHVHIGYVPAERVVGLSKLARVVDAVTRRLQIQERMTTEIADTIDEVLQPRGVAVVIEASHGCMCSRGVHKEGVVTVTSRLAGAFKTDRTLRAEFWAAIRGHGHGGQS